LKFFFNGKFIKEFSFFLLSFYFVANLSQVWQFTVNEKKNPFAQILIDGFRGKKYGLGVIRERGQLPCHAIKICFLYFYRLGTFDMK
jgi:hypothetical protein